MGRLLSLLRGVEQSLHSRFGRWMQEVSAAGDSAAGNISTLQTLEAQDAANISTLQTLEAQDAANISTLQTLEAQDAANIAALQAQQVLLASPQVPLALDTNSLVVGDVAAREWHSAVPTHYPTVQANAAVGPDGFQDAVYVNIDGAATAFGQLTRYFSVPVGVSEVYFEVPMKLPTGVVAAAPVIDIWSGQFGVQIGTLTCNLTGAWVTYTLGPIAVSPGEYTVRIAVGPGLAGAQEKALVGRVRVRPAAGFMDQPQNFRRINVDARVLNDNAYSKLVAAGEPEFWMQTQWSRVVMDTTATKLGIEFFDSVSLQIVGQPDVTALGVLVDGKPWAVVTSTGVLRNQYAVVNLPVGAKRVEVVNGPQYQTGTGLANVTGKWLVGLYVDTDETLNIWTPQNSNGVTIYGDSIASGYFADTPVFDGWPMLLRRSWLGNVYSESWAGRSLNWDATATVSALVSQLAAYQARYYWLAIGRNDWGGNGGLGLWSAANFGTRYAELLDALHAAVPAAAIFCQSPISQAVEGANSFGDNLAAYRTQVSNASAARAWTTFVDGTTILAVGDLGDGVHPNNVGSAKYAKFVLNALGV